ncbi:MAG: tRNA 5-methoxyuridine(34)/uridine 5-oxyacetic acid(34) synthase CmoB, partial [Zetaproteobacteria bacterium CG_4_9_14_3_um_filter_53_7]
MKTYKDHEGLKLQAELAQSPLAGFSDVLMPLYEKGW